MKVVIYFILSPSVWLSVIADRTAHNDLLVVHWLQTACSLPFVAIRSAWSMCDARPKLIDIVLSLPNYSKSLLVFVKNCVIFVGVNAAHRIIRMMEREKEHSCHPSREIEREREFWTEWKLMISAIWNIIGLHLILN